MLEVKHKTGPEGHDYDDRDAALKGRSSTARPKLKVTPGLPSQ